MQTLALHFKAAFRAITPARLCIRSLSPLETTLASHSCRSLWKRINQIKHKPCTITIWITWNETALRNGIQTHILLLNHLSKASLQDQALFRPSSARFYSSTSALHKAKLFLLYTPRNLEPRSQRPTRKSSKEKKKTVSKSKGHSDKSSNTAATFRGMAPLRACAAQRGTGVLWMPKCRKSLQHSLSSPLPTTCGCPQRLKRNRSLSLAHL